MTTPSPFGVGQGEREALVAAGVLERVEPDEPDPLDRAPAGRLEHRRPGRQLVDLAGDREDLVEVGVEDASRLRPSSPRVRPSSRPPEAPIRRRQDDDEDGAARTAIAEEDDGGADRRGRRRAFRSIGRSSGTRAVATAGPSLASARFDHAGRLRRRPRRDARYPPPTRDPRPRRHPDRPMAKRKRLGARPRASATSPAPTGRPRPATAPGGGVTPDEEEARAAELEAAILAEEKARRRRPRERSRRATTRPRGRPIWRPRTSVAEDDEYAYVQRDLRRIVVVGGLLIAILARGPRRPRTSRDRRPKGGGARRATPARPTPHGSPPCPPGRPPAAPPRALFKPPPERQPLAARMRPRTLDEFVGQEHLVGERGPLRPRVARGHLASILLWGPPGTGKTSLARLLAEAVGAEFATLSAVMSGVAEVRATIAEPRSGSRSTSSGRSCSSTRSTASTRPSRTRSCRTSRTARSRSSARRPRTPTSRSTRAPVADARLAARAADRRRRRARSSAARSPTRSAASPALGPDGGVALDDAAFEHLVDVAGGDARSGAQRPRGRGRAGRGRGIRDATGRVSPTARGRRGRRPAAGPRLRPRRRRPLRHGLGVHQEPPRQRPRRRALLAGRDDRGRRGPAVHRPAADHRARRRTSATPTRARSRSPSRPPRRSTTSACPEAQYALAQATTYIATAPKSNRSGRPTGAAVADVEANGLAARPEPPAQRAGDRRMKQPRDRRRLRYPHDFEGADVEQQYLPDELVGRRYYVRPTRATRRRSCVAETQRKDAADGSSAYCPSWSRAADLRRIGWSIMIDKRRGRS